MGHVESKLIPLQTRVRAKPALAENHYFGTIIQCHGYDRYDVEFDDKHIETIFYEEIIIVDDNDRPEFRPPKPLKPSLMYPKPSDDNKSYVITAPKFVFNNNNDKNNKNDKNNNAEKWPKIYSSLSTVINEKKGSLEVKINKWENEEDVDDETIKNIIEICYLFGNEQNTNDLLNDFSHHIKNDIVYIIQDGIGKEGKKDDGVIIKYLLSMIDIQNITLKNIPWNLPVDEIKNLNCFKRLGSLCYGLYLNLDYDTYYNEQNSYKNEEFENQIKKEINKITLAPMKYVRIENIFRGGIIVIVSFSIFASIALGLTGRFEWEYLFSKKGDSQSENIIKINNIVAVKYKDRYYDAEVIQIQESITSKTVKIKYKGSPFMFQNEETLPFNSPRFMFKTKPSQSAKIRVDKESTTLYLKNLDPSEE